jgi:hypothetical protein
MNHHAWDGEKPIWPLGTRVICVEPFTGSTSKPNMKLGDKAILDTEVLKENNSGYVFKIEGRKSKNRFVFWKGDERMYEVIKNEGSISSLIRHEVIRLKGEIDGV